MHTAQASRDKLWPCFEPEVAPTWDTVADTLHVCLVFRFVLRSSGGKFRNKEAYVGCGDRQTCVRVAAVPYTGGVCFSRMCSGSHRNNYAYTKVAWRFNQMPQWLRLNCMKLPILKVKNGQTFTISYTSSYYIMCLHI